MDATTTGVVALLSAIVSIAVALIGLYFAVKKHPFDIRKLDLEVDKQMGEIIQQYKDLAGGAIGDNVKLHQEIQSVRERLDEIKARHEQELTEIREALARAEIRATKFEDWAKRLVAQIESLGEVPVPFEPKPRNPTQPRRE